MRICPFHIDRAVNLFDHTALFSAGKEAFAGQEETPAAPVQEQPEEDQEVFRPVEKYTLYCMEDTRVYEEADTASAVAEVLTEGEAFDVTAETDTWYQVLYGTGQKQGFVKKKEGSFTREMPERGAAIVEEEGEEMLSICQQQLQDDIQ